MLFKRILRRLPLPIGVLCSLSALFSDLLRGRPVFWGAAQIALFVFGILLIALGLFYTKITNELSIIIQKTQNEVNQLMTSLTVFLNINFTNNFVRLRAFWKISHFLLFFVMFVLLLEFSRENFSMFSPNEWISGDWLINYQGGFVRRGLSGEVILLLSRLLGTQGTIIVVFLQIISYLIFFVFCYRLVLFSSIDPVNFALIYSPAFMLFPVNSEGGGFRKEILFFAFFSFICYYLAIHKGKVPIIVYIFICIFSSVLVLSHEMLLFFLPYVVCAFIILNKGFTKQVAGVCIALIPAGLLGIYVFLFGSGSDSIVREICNSLSGYAPSQCTTHGAIFFLSKNLDEAHKYVLEYASKENIIASVLSAILGSAPLMMKFFSKETKQFLSEWRSPVWLIIGIALTILISLPLFWVAADFGRLIYIHVTSISLLVLVMNSKISINHPTIGLSWLLGWALSLIYILGWKLDHWNAEYSTTFPLIEKTLADIIS